MGQRIILFSVLFISVLFGQPRFEKFFKDSTLRIDYYHIGDHQSELITIDRFYLLKFWSGTKSKLIDPFDIGKYYIQVFDSSAKNLLFSKGFNSYFGEYQTTAEAKQGTRRTFHESALIPFPKEKILFKLLARNRQNKLHVIFEQKIDPEKIQINSENRAAKIKIIKAHHSGTPHQNVDIVFLAEGYTLQDSARFRKDLQHYTNVLLQKDPFSKYSNKINIYGVYKPSAQSGCDEPTLHKYRNTVLNCTFNSMGSYRYLLTEDNKTMQDLASAVPHDAIIIMVNQTRYGGGGIYNFYMDFTTGNAFSENVFIHEFGHSFAGLADEYYTSSTAYDEFYPTGVEPTEPNITRLLNPENLKWKDLVSAGTPIPTPWRKQEFDRLQLDYQKKRQQLIKEIVQLSKRQSDSLLLKRKKAGLSELQKKYNRLLDQILHQDPYSNKVGAFEGAGYLSTGMYRPMLDCVMFRNGDKPFCRVCARRIEEMLKFLSE